MTLTMFGSLIGGLGLFLLGMQLMTNGLKSAAGEKLRSTLEKATQSPLRGLLSGTLITALVQSSSAVTIATIGFVNAGLLNLRQAINVIYGCNIGTTMTGWLIAAIGFKLKITAFALPMIGIGMLLHLISRGDRGSALGTALTGFGIFFLGIGVLKTSFAGLEQLFILEEFNSGGLIGTLIFISIGFILTNLTASSSAAIAITLSVAASGAIPLTAAAAVVIGANVGTTTTAGLAVIGATPNAKRIAAAHVLFNLITALIGIIALTLLSGLLDSPEIQALDMVTLLALFHTLFNLVGIAVIWPFTEHLVRLLKVWFRQQEISATKPRYLDRNILETPTLALEALAMELSRVSSHACAMAKEAISAEHLDIKHILEEQRKVEELVLHTGDFNHQIAKRSISQEVSESLPQALRVGRYYTEMARLSGLIVNYSERFERIDDETLKRAIFKFKSATIALIEASTLEENQYLSASDSHHLIRELQRQYQDLKSDLLVAGTEGKLPPREMVDLLDSLSHIHRLAEQAEKGARYWSYLTPIQHRSPVKSREQREH